MIFLPRIRSGKSAFFVLAFLAVFCATAVSFETADKDAKNVGEFKVAPENAGAWSHYLKAETLYFEARFEDALGEYREAVRLNPADFDSRYKIGRVLYEMKRRGEAVKEWKNLAALKPDYGLAHHWLGVAYREEGKPEDAVIELVEAMKHLRDTSETRLHLGSALEERGDLDGAIEVWEKAAAEYPEFAQIHFRLGFAYLKKDKKKKDRALAAFESAAAAKPDFAEAHHEAAKILAASPKKTDQVIKSFKSAIAADPKFLEARYGLAAVLKKAKKPEEAAAVYRGILEIDPAQSSAHIALGDLSLEKNDTDKAIYHYNEAITAAGEDDVGNPDAYFGLGRAWIAREKYAEAIEALEHAIELAPKSADPYFHLGLARKGNRDYDEALEAFERYTKLARRRSPGIVEARKIMRDIRTLVEEAEGG